MNNSRFSTFSTITPGVNHRLAKDRKECLRNMVLTALSQAATSIKDVGHYERTYSKETGAELVIASNRNLGFGNGAKLRNTYARISELGYELFPQSRRGLQMFLQCSSLSDKGGFEVALIEEVNVVLNEYKRIQEYYKRSDLRKNLPNNYHYDGEWSADTNFVFFRRTI
ncbi:MAG: hypothetical protein Q7K40_01460 [bacterium]|nr:hypothetical protein [bacterium]